MNRLFKVIGSVFLTFSVTLSVLAATPINPDLRILSPVLPSPDMSAPEITDPFPLPNNSQMKPVYEMGYSEPHQYGQKITNLVDGYSIVVPAGMSMDLTRSDICMTVSDDIMTARIFKEEFSTTNDRLSYLTYSNKFLENTADHKEEMKTTYSYGNYKYYILQWSRRTLAKIKNDKNYYACVDVCQGKTVYTFFFTSSVPFETLGGYMHIVDSLQTFSPTIPKESAYNKGFHGTNISHLNTAVSEKYQELFGPESTFKMGLFSPFGGLAKLEELENTLGYEFCTFLTYSEVTDPVGLGAEEYEAKALNHLASIESLIRYAQDKNKAIELTLQTPLARSTPSNMIYEILNGDHDKFLNDYADIVARFPDTAVLFRPFNEMNGDWCNYCAYHTSRDPQLYVELYKYLYDIFKKAGCKNVIWVWNPNEKSFPGYKWNHQDLYYPGDEYVDVFGITGYNTGTYYKDEKWRSFDQIYSPIYQRLERLNDKPIMITEFSCSSIGGDKVQWIEDMFSVLPRYGKIKLAIWWGGADFDGENYSRPYFFDSPVETLDVFDKYLN